MESDKTNEVELTSTMGNLLSTNKDEKNDGSDSTPTSSTDASTSTSTLQIGGADDPISSTSSETTESKKFSEKSSQNIQSTASDHASLAKNLSVENQSSPIASAKDLLDMNITDTSAEKITENVDDIVQDLENLLGESGASFDFSVKSKKVEKGQISATDTNDDLDDFELQMAEGRPITNAQESLSVNETEKLTSSQTESALNKDVVSIVNVVETPATTCTETEKCQKDTENRLESNLSKVDFSKNLETETKEVAPPCEIKDLDELTSADAPTCEAKDIDTQDLEAVRDNETMQLEQRTEGEKQISTLEEIVESDRQNVLQVAQDKPTEIVLEGRNVISTEEAIDSGSSKTLNKEEELETHATEGLKDHERERVLVAKIAENIQRSDIKTLEIHEKLLPDDFKPEEVSSDIADQSQAFNSERMEVTESSGIQEALSMDTVKVEENLSELKDDESESKSLESDRETLKIDESISESQEHSANVTTVEESLSKIEEKLSTPSVKAMEIDESLNEIAGKCEASSDETLKVGKDLSEIVESATPAVESAESIEETLKIGDEAVSEILESATPDVEPLETLKIPETVSEIVESATPTAESTEGTLKINEAILEIVESAAPVEPSESTAESLKIGETVESATSAAESTEGTLKIGEAISEIVESAALVVEPSESTAEMLKIGEAVSETMESSTPTAESTEETLKIDEAISEIVESATPDVEQIEETLKIVESGTPDVESTEETLKIGVDLSEFVAPVTPDADTLKIGNVSEIMESAEPTKETLKINETISEIEESATPADESTEPAEETVKIVVGLSEVMDTATPPLESIEGLSEIAETAAAVAESTEVVRSLPEIFETLAANASEDSMGISVENISTHAELASDENLKKSEEGATLSLAPESPTNLPNFKDGTEDVASNSRTEEQHNHKSGAQLLEESVQADENVSVIEEKLALSNQEVLETCESLSKDVDESKVVEESVTSTVENLKPDDNLSVTVEESHEVPTLSSMLESNQSDDLVDQVEDNTNQDILLDEKSGEPMQGDSGKDKESDKLLIIGSETNEFEKPASPMSGIDENPIDITNEQVTLRKENREPGTGVKDVIILADSEAEESLKTDVGSLDIVTSVENEKETSTNNEEDQTIQAALSELESMVDTVQESVLSLPELENASALLVDDLLPSESNDGNMGSLLGNENDKQTPSQMESSSNLNVDVEILKNSLCADIDVLQNENSCLQSVEEHILPPSIEDLEVLNAISSLSDNQSEVVSSTSHSMMCSTEETKLSTFESTETSSSTLPDDNLETLLAVASLQSDYAPADFTPEQLPFEIEDEKDQSISGDITDFMQKETEEVPQISGDISEVNTNPQEDEVNSTVQDQEAKLKEPLVIKIDDGDKDKIYSPKITIKPIKSAEGEMVATSSSCDIDEKESKGCLKMTITKQSDTMHSILKIYDPDDDNTPDVQESQSEPSVPKLIIKPIVQSNEQPQSPKISSRTAKQVFSPSTSNNQRSASPRITIKPIVKPDHMEPVSPFKITIKPVLKPDESIRQKHSPKLTIKPIMKPDDEVRDSTETKLHSPRVTIKPIVKPAEEVEQVPSPRITIKPIVKPDSVLEQISTTTPKVTIKPVLKPQEKMVDITELSFSPKITIKPIIKPQELEPANEETEDSIKERIVLKINKGTLPSTSKESRKRDLPLEEEKSEKLAKIKLKFSKEGGHPHIVQDESPSKRQKTEEHHVTITPIGPSVTHSKLKEMLSAKSNFPVVNLDDDDDDITIVEDAANSKPSPIVISEESNQEPMTITLEMQENDIPVFEITPDCVKTVHPQPAQVVIEPSITPPAPRKRGRPRKVPLQVREDFKDPKDEEPKPVIESTRPKRSCRGQSVRATLGIKPRKPRGPGRGRGSKRGMGTRSTASTPDMSPIPSKEPKLSLKHHLRHPKEDLLILGDKTEVRPIDIDDGFYKSPLQSLLAPPQSETSTTDRADIVMYEEETRMSAETNSRAQTPAKQVVSSVPSADIVEESQSSVQSSATTESVKVRRGPRLEVHQEPEGAVISADQLAEYYWSGGGPYMLQEQVAQFLGIKSFKRKYPNIPRRLVEMQERDFIRESGLAGEAMCDLGLTAVNSADILDIMYSDFQDKYEEYCKHQRDRQAKDLTNKQKALSLAASQEKTKMDITQQAVQSAASWNATFNKARRDQRKACMDLQTLTVHYPKGRMKQINRPKVGNYPVALVPGQFTDFYAEFTPTELNNLPLNTLCYIPIIKGTARELDCDSQTDGSGSESESSSSDSDSSYSGSSDAEDCTLCKPMRKVVAAAQ